MQYAKIIAGILILVFSLFGCGKEEKLTWDGPFGLQEGLELSDFLKGYKVTDPKPGKLIYEAMDVPKPDDRFTHYQLWFDRDAGLCKIVAQGKMLTVNDEGTQLIKRYNQVAKSLIEKYGPMTDDFDFVKVDSPLSGNHEWMMSLFKKERVLGGYWEEGKVKRDGTQKTLKLPNNIEAITVNARAYSPTTGAVDVEYEFSNFPQCEVSAHLSPTAMSVEGTFNVSREDDEIY